MKKQKLPSKDWIGLAIDAIIRGTPKDFLTRQEKIDIRAELSKPLFKDISQIIDPVRPTTFALNSCVVVDNYDSHQGQFQILGWQGKFKITIDLVCNEDVFWKASGIHIDYSY